MISFRPDTGRRPHSLVATALQVPANDILLRHRSPSPQTVTLAETGDHDRHNQRSRRIAVQLFPEQTTTQRGTLEFADHQNVQCTFGGVPTTTTGGDTLPAFGEVEHQITGAEQATAMRGSEGSVRVARWPSPEHPALQAAAHRPSRRLWGLRAPPNSPTSDPSARDARPRT